MQMGKKQKKAVRSGQTPAIHQAVTLREENAGKKSVNVSSILKMQHLQKLARWAGGEAGIPQLGALFGHRLASNAEAAGIPLDVSCFLCQRCETILQPGFNCTVRIEKNAKGARPRKKSCSASQNNVIYTCTFCTHPNLMRGTPGGHLKGLLASRPRLDSDAKLHCSEDTNLSNSKTAVASIKELSSDRETPIERSPLTPLEKLRGRPKKKRKAIGSVSGNPHLVGGESSTTATDSAKGNGGSSKRKRKGWSSLKDIAEGTEEAKTQSLTNFAIPFLL